MTPVRFRTTILTLAVVSGSVVTGVGLGRFLTKVAHARPTPHSAIAQNNDGPQGSSGAERAAALGLRKRPYFPTRFPRPAAVRHGFPGASMTAKPLPMFTYNVTASPDLGGGNFTGTILGRSPFNRGKTVTTIPVQLVPLIITINDGTTTVTYDPTAADTCVTGHTAVDIITGSPLFNNSPFTMNGVNVGNTQYIDAHQRAQFWSAVQGSNYHLIFSQTVLPAQTINVNLQNSSGQIGNFNLGCADLGIMQINDLDADVTALITGPLAGTINVGTFPVFLTRNVVLSFGDIATGCCILGYHNAFSVGPNIQIYSPASVDTIGAFGPGFTNTMSHELAEATDDPSVNNLTPPWGEVGQTMGFCQNNLENGDPLSEGFGTPTNPFTVVMPNGLTYSLQELVYFRWFFGGPSGGAGGDNHYSNNGAFCGPAIICEPGSTTFCP
jgi:hypothetical protein